MVDGSGPMLKDRQNLFSTDSDLPRADPQKGAATVSGSVHCLLFVTTRLFQPVDVECLKEVELAAALLNLVLVVEENLHAT